MSILLTSETDDYDLATGAIVLNHTMVAAGDVRLNMWAGTEAKPCVATAGVWELRVYLKRSGMVNYHYMEPYPQEMLASVALRKLFVSKVFDLNAGDDILVNLKSPNAGDSDVGVYVELIHVTGALPAVAPNAVGGLPVLNAASYVEADVKAVRAQALSAKAGTNFDALFQNGGVDSTLTLTGATGIALQEGVVELIGKTGDLPTSRHFYIDGVAGDDDSADPHSPLTPVKTWTKLFSNGTGIIEQATAGPVVLHVLNDVHTQLAEDVFPSVSRENAGPVHIIGHGWPRLWTAYNPAYEVDELCVMTMHTGTENSEITGCRIETSPKHGLHLLVSGINVHGNIITSKYCGVGVSIGTAVGDGAYYIEPGQPVFAEGTVDITQGGTTVTLSSGVWPDWAGESTLLDIDDVEYAVASRTDDTHIELEDAWVPATVNASEYSIRQAITGVRNCLVHDNTIILGDFADGSQGGRGVKIGDGALSGYSSKNCFVWGNRIIGVYNGVWFGNCTNCFSVDNKIGDLCNAGARSIYFTADATDCASYGDHNLSGGTPTVSPDPPINGCLISASTTDVATIADDAIKAATFDESTAFPLKSADTGSTAVARTGADSDTLETLSDQLDGVPTSGSGSVSTTIRITEDGLEGGTPVADADVWITTDAAGSNTVAGTLQTDSSGEATFSLDPRVYYVWAQKDGYQWLSGSTLTVT